MTLLEVLIAAIILAATIIPLYKMMGGSTKAGEDTEKIQMAIKAAQSVKEELNAVGFTYYVQISDKGPPDANGEWALDPDLFYPISAKEVAKFQEKFRDFKVTARYKFLQQPGKTNKDIVYGTIDVTWFQPVQGDQKRTTNVTIVKPM